MQRRSFLTGMAGLMGVAGPGTGAGSFAATHPTAEVDIEDYSGTLPDRLRAAIDEHGAAIYRVPRDNAGNRWVWDQTLSVEQSGLRIVSPMADVDVTVDDAPVIEDAGADRIVIDGFYFRDGGGSPTYGVYLTDDDSGASPNHCTIKRVIVERPNVGFAADGGGWKNHFERCYALRPETDGYQLGSGATNGPGFVTNSSLHGCYASYAGRYGFHINGANNITTIECGSDASGADAYYANGGNKSLVNIGFHVERANTDHDSDEPLIHVSGFNSATWIGGLFQDLFNSIGEKRVGYRASGGTHTFLGVEFGVRGDELRLNSTIGDGGELGDHHPEIHWTAVRPPNPSIKNDATGPAQVYRNGSAMLAVDLSSYTGRYSGETHRNASGPGPAEPYWYDGDAEVWRAYSDPTSTVSVG